MSEMEDGALCCFSVCGLGVLVLLALSSVLRVAEKHPPAPPPSCRGQAFAPSCFCSHSWEGHRCLWVEFPAPPLLSTRGQSWPGCAEKNCNFYLLDVAGCISFVTGSCYRKYQMFLEVEGII